MVRRELLLREYGAAADAVAAMIAGLGPLNEVANPIAASFYANIRGLRQRSIDFLLKRHGVPVLTLARDGDGLGATLGEAFVAFDDRGRFDFANDPNADGARRALIATARDRCGGPLDLVAWQPNENLVASHLGRAILLGEHEIEMPRDTPLRVHRGLLDWLKADRTGVVIINERRAWRLLHDEDIAASDVAHGLALRKLLRSPAPRVVVPETAVAA